jgi:hypothetical protein
MVIAITAIAVASAALGAQRRETHPTRFQVDGWSATCEPGTDGFAAECQAVKKAAGYTLRLSVGDAQLYQAIEHAGCQPESNQVMREDAPQMSGPAQRRWIAATFDGMAREMAKRCPKLPPLNRKAYQQPPSLNSAGHGDIR